MFQHLIRIEVWMSCVIVVGEVCRNPYLGRSNLERMLAQSVQWFLLLSKRPTLGGMSVESARRVTKLIVSVSTSRLFLFLLSEAQPVSPQRVVMGR